MATTQNIPESPLKVFKIIPTTQQYDWGKRGRAAKVAVFAEASKLPGFAVDEDAPYAEVSRLYIFQGGCPGSSPLWGTS